MFPLLKKYISYNLSNFYKLKPVTVTLLLFSLNIESSKYFNMPLKCFIFTFILKYSSSYDIPFYSSPILVDSINHPNS